MTTKRDSPKKTDKKKPYALRLRPSTIALLGEASQAAAVSKNAIVEKGAIAEAKKTMKKSKKVLTSEWAGSKM